MGLPVASLAKNVGLARIRYAQFYSWTDSNPDVLILDITIDMSGDPESNKYLWIVYTREDSDEDQRGAKKEDLNRAE